MTAESQIDQPRWPRPPEAGYTVDDLFELPDLPPHTELIDGSLVFMAPQRNFHSLMIDHLVHTLRQCAPAMYRVRREMAVVLSRQTVLEPDVAVLWAGSVTGPDQASFRPEDVVLAVEVESPSSVERDRDTKPHKYAGVGIRYFWRIEREGCRIVAHTYELDRESGRYTAARSYVNQLTVDEPFPVSMDLTEADRL